MKRGLFKIEAEGNDITHLIRDRFLDLYVTDAAGKDSDSFRLVLDNRDDKITLPATGYKLRIWIGLDGAMVDKGQFTVDEISESLDTGDIEVTGRAADMTATINKAKTCTWDGPLKLADLANTIAVDHGYSCQVHPSLASIELGHINQKAESDMNLLTRLCEAHSALMKLGGGYLLIVPREAGEAATGAPLGEVLIDDPSKSSGRVTIQEAATTKAVQTCYFDAANQQLVNVVVGEKDAKPMELKGRCKDEAEAVERANAKLRELARGKAKMSLTRPLTPEIVSPGKVRVANHRQSANGVWFVESAEHHVGSSGVSSTALQLSTHEHDSAKRK